MEETAKKLPLSKVRFEYSLSCVLLTGFILSLAVLFSNSNAFKDVIFQSFQRLDVKYAAVSSIVALGPLSLGLINTNLLVEQWPHHIYLIFFFLSGIADIIVIYTGDGTYIVPLHILQEIGFTLGLFGLLWALQKRMATDLLAIMYSSLWALSVLLQSIFSSYDCQFTLFVIPYVIAGISIIMFLVDSFDIIVPPPQQESLSVATKHSRVLYMVVLVCIILAGQVSTAYGYTLRKSEYGDYLLFHYLLRTFCLVHVNAMSPMSLHVDAEVALTKQKTFVRNLSHEIRTPMNAAFVGLQLMREAAISQIKQDTSTLPARHSVIGFQHPSPSAASKQSSNLEHSFHQLMADSRRVLSPQHRTTTNALDDMERGDNSGKISPSRRLVAMSQSGACCRESPKSDRMDQNFENDASDSDPRNRPTSLVYIDEVTTSCEIALEVLNEMLLFDKINSGIMTAEYTVAEMLGVILDPLKSLKISATYKRINLVLPQSHLSQKYYECMVVVDVPKIAKVMRNLVSNAIKFSPEKGCVSVDIGFEKKSALLAMSKKLRDQVKKPHPDIMRVAKANKLSKNGYVRVSVSDNGVGIAKDNQERLFGEIMQIKPGKYQNGQGSGLGLLISGEIVHLHSGIYAVSSPGEGLGSTFTIYLPAFFSTSSIVMRDSDSEYSFSVSTILKSVRISPSMGRTLLSRTVLSDNKENKVVHPEVLESEYKRSFDNGFTSDICTKAFVLRRVMIVDDTSSNRKILRRLLGTRNTRDIDEAETGAEAIEKLRSVIQSVADSGSDTETMYDLILLDYEMPGLTGPETAKAIRDMGYNRAIIGLTGHIEESIHKLFRNMGADAVLGKPLNLKEFDIVLTDILQARRNE